MFKRLRNKFLLLNMSIITILLLGAFSIVHTFTVYQINRNIDMKLTRSLNMDSDRPGKPVPPNESRMEPEPPQQLSIDFTVKTNSDGTIKSINSIFDIEDSVYEYIAKTATLSDKDRGRFKFESTNWAYAKLPAEEGGFNIAVLDISRETSLLRDLILAFSFVSLVALLIIFIISLFFTTKAIHPVEEVWEKQTQFIADASHELKTPLTTINTNVDVLLSHPDSTIKAESKWLEYIKGEAERMTRLTNDLLYLARIDKDEDAVMHTEFSLSDTVKNVILTMEAVIFEKNLKFAESIEEYISFSGNPDQIKQLVMILLDNAIKYTSDNGEISLNLKRQDKKIVLSVSNTGEPIPAEHAEKIFDRFYRADRSRARESGGYGLGLSIAKAICVNHGGHLTFQSANDLNTFNATFNA